MTIFPANDHFNSGDESPAAAEHGRHPVAGYEARIAALERKIDQLTMELDMVKKTSQLRPLELVILEK